MTDQLLKNKSTLFSKDKIKIFLKSAALIAVFEVFFFRNVIFSHGLIGDFIDARLNNIFIEHWYRVLLGLDSITNLRFFAPVENSIFFSDLLLGLAPLYCLLRFVGLSMFTANKIVLISLHYFGSLSLYLILRQGLKISRIVSLIALFISSYGCAYAVRLNYSHTQMMTVSVVPLFFFSLVMYLKELTLDCSYWHNKDNIDSNDSNYVCGNRKKRLLWGIVSSLTLLFMLYTSFYVFFFTFIFCLFTFVIFFISLHIKNAKNSLSLEAVHQLKAAKKRLGEVGLFLVLTLLFMLPAGFGYFISAGHLERFWFEVAMRILNPHDIVNVSQFNWLYGSFINTPYFINANNYGELQAGLPLLTLLLAIFSLVALFMHPFKNYWPVFIQSLSNGQSCDQSSKANNNDENNNNPALYQKDLAYQLLIACAAGFILCMLCIIRWENYSLWWFIYKFIPGGKGIRMTARFAVFLYWPLSFIVALYLNFEEKNNRRKITKALLSLVFAVVFLESQLAGGLHGFWDSTSQEAFIKSVPPPPKSCQYFFVTHSTNRHINEDDWEKVVDDQLAASLIANEYNIETFNGYSGGNPPKWYLRNIELPSYFNSAYSWIERWKINKDQVYVYNFTKRQWKDFTTTAKGLLKVVDYDNPNIVLNGECTVTEAGLNRPGEININKDSYLLSPEFSPGQGNYFVYIIGPNIDKSQISILDVSQNNKELNPTGYKKAGGQAVVYFSLNHMQKVKICIKNMESFPVTFLNMSFEEQN